MKKAAFIAIVSVVCCAQMAFLPWTEEMAKEDPEKSDAIIMGRVIGMEQTEDQVGEDTWPDGKKLKHRIKVYNAIIQVTSVLKGADLKVKDTIKIEMGYDMQEPYDEKIGDNYPAQVGLTLANTQLGYDFRINHLYFMFLKKQDKKWDLRSGPYSLGWIQTENKISFGKIGQQWSDNISYSEYVDSLHRRINQK